MNNAQILRTSTSLKLSLRSKEEHSKSYVIISWHQNPTYCENPENAY